MLNKRIKSVLVAGLVVLGMTGNVFAAEYQWDFSSGVNNIDYSKVEQSGEYKGYYVKEFQGGNIIFRARDLSGTKNPNVSGENNAYAPNTFEYTIEYRADLFDLDKVHIKFKDTSIQDRIHEYVGKYPQESDKGDNWKKVIVAETMHGAPNSFEIFYSLVDADKDNIPDAKDDNVPPQEGIKDPAAGDANTMIMLGGGAALAGTALVLLNRKKEDEE